MASTPTGQSTLDKVRRFGAFNVIVTPRSRMGVFDPTELVWSEDDKISSRKNMTTKMVYSQKVAFVHVDNIRKYWKNPRIRKEYRKYGHRRLTVLAATLHHELRHVVVQNLHYLEALTALDEFISDGDFTKEEEDQFWAIYHDPTKLDHRYKSGLPGEEQWISDDPIHQQFLTELRQLNQDKSWLRKLQKAITPGPMRPEDEKVFEWLREQRESATGPDYLPEDNRPRTPVTGMGGPPTHPPQPAPAEIPEFIRKAQEKVLEDLRRIRERQQSVTRHNPSVPDLPDPVDFDNHSTDTVSPSPFPDPIISQPSPTTQPPRKPVKRHVIPEYTPVPPPDQLVPLPTTSPIKEDKSSEQKQQQDKDNDAATGSSATKNKQDKQSKNSDDDKDSYKIQGTSFTVDEEQYFTILKSSYRKGDDKSSRQPSRTVKGKLFYDKKTDATYIRTKDELIKIQVDEAVIGGDPVITWD